MLLALAFPRKKLLVVVLTSASSAVPLVSFSRQVDHRVGYKLYFWHTNTVEKTPRTIPAERNGSRFVPHQGCQTAHFLLARPNFRYQLRAIAGKTIVCMFLLLATHILRKCASCRPSWIKYFGGGGLKMVDVTHFRPIQGTAEIRPAETGPNWS